MGKAINGSLLNSTIFNYVDRIQRGSIGVPPLRITQAEWQYLLLNNQDNVLCRGRLVKLIGTRIGPGVYEITFKMGSNSSS